MRLTDRQIRMVTRATTRLAYTAPEIRRELLEELAFNVVGAELYALQRELATLRGLPASPELQGKLSAILDRLAVRLGRSDAA